MLFVMMIAACTDSAHVTPYGLFMADGVFDPADPDYIPPTFDAFFTDTLGWEASEIEVTRTEAKQFFADSYGVDVDALVSEGRLQWLEYRVDPRSNYRVYALPDRPVQPEGWPIEEIAFSAIAIDPTGVPLGGPYAGINFAPGPIGAFGFYHFDALAPDGSFDEAVTIAYHTDGVMATSLDGRNLLYCVMDSPQIGQGLGHITSEIVQQDNGQLAFDFTNVQRWGADAIR